MSHVSDELSRILGIPGVAEVVDGNGGLPKVQITAPTASGEMYLHGAHVTCWTPVGAEEVLFLSSRAQWQDGLAIRGGIPICFPWFRGKADDPKAPAHGFVRTRSWQLESIARDGDAVVITMFTVNDESTEQWWPGKFRLEHRASFGSELGLQLTVTNTGQTPFRFEEALHTYNRVGDVAKARVTGLDGVRYLDNTDSNREKTQAGDLLLARQTDSAYMIAAGPAELDDPVLQRRIRLTKEGSQTTVVWNPWSDGAAALSDLGENEWQQMLCVEASNVLGCAIHLAPGEQHIMKAMIRVQGAATR